MKNHVYIRFNCKNILKFKIKILKIHGKSEDKINLRCNRQILLKNEIITSFFDNSNKYLGIVDSNNFIYFFRISDK